jgi:hypothetical protein
MLDHKSLARNLSNYMVFFRRFVVTLSTGRDAIAQSDATEISVSILIRARKIDSRLIMYDGCKRRIEVRFYRTIDNV